MERYSNTKCGQITRLSDKYREKCGGHQDEIRVKYVLETFFTSLTTMKIMTLKKNQQYQSYIYYFTFLSFSS